MKLTAAALRVDFAGGWLDVPAYARKGAFIVNCTITPLVTLESWPYERCAGLGGSAAHALLTGRDALAEELKRAGWQDPASIMESGLCVWRSGKEPVLEAKHNPEWLAGRMALLWSGQTHVTEELLKKERDYHLIELAGHEAARAACLGDLYGLSKAVNMSHQVQVHEGMEPIHLAGRHHAMAAKYCGSGWGGYMLFLFKDQVLRDGFVNEQKEALAIEPYLRSVHSSVLLWNNEQ